MALLKIFQFSTLTFPIIIVCKYFNKKNELVLIKNQQLSINRKNESVKIKYSIHEINSKKNSERKYEITFKLINLS